MIHAVNIFESRLLQRGVFAKYTLAEKLEFLAARRIAAVVNLSPHADHELAQAVGAARYLHAYIRDGVSFDFVRLERAATFARTALATAPDAAVLAHCYAGKNRSAFLNCILLMDVWGFSAQAAIRQVRHARPNALATPAFEWYLLNRRNQNETDSD